MRPINVEEVPYHIPGICLKCRVTNGPNRKYFVDTGIDIDYYGVVYLCDCCISDIVTKLPDFFDKKYVDNLLESQYQFIEDAKKREQKAQRVLQTLEALGIDFEKLIAAVEVEEKPPVKIGAPKLGKTDGTTGLSGGNPLTAEPAIAGLIAGGDPS